MKQSSNKGHARQRSNGRKKSNSDNNGNNRRNSFDSTGPAGKIRGTAAFVLERYMAAAKDALSNSDFVLAENCYQHADHYTRIYNTISEAKQLQEQQRRERQQEKDDQRQFETDDKSDDVGNVVVELPSFLEEVEASADQDQEQEVETVKIERKPVRERRPRRTISRKKTIIDTSENVTVVAAPEIMSV